MLERTVATVIATVIIAITATLLGAAPGRAQNARRQTDFTPTGHVRGGDGRPLVGARLRFQDATGRAVTIVTDARGMFRADLDRLTHDRSDGFTQTVRGFSSGGPTNYFFAPLGVREALVRDSRGRPVSGLRIGFVRKRQVTQSVTDRSGKASVTGVPVVPSRAIGGEYLLSAVRVGSELSVMSVREQTFPRKIRYLVSVAPSATIAGTLAVPGSKPGGWYVFATGKRENGEVLYYNAVTTAAGRFRIKGVLPGRYYVGARPGSGGRTRSRALPVRVQSGQTTTIQLRAKQ